MASSKSSLAMITSESPLQDVNDSLNRLQNNANIKKKTQKKHKVANNSYELNMETHIMPLNYLKHVKPWQVFQVAAEMGTELKPHVCYRLRKHIKKVCLC